MLSNLTYKPPKTLVKLIRYDSTQRNFNETDTVAFENQINSTIQTLQNNKCNIVNFVLLNETLAYIIYTQD